MRGHLVYEVAGRRYVLIPRDHRVKPRCYRCALGTQRRGEFFVPCPVDGRGNKVCEFGQGWTFMRIGANKVCEFGQGWTFMRIGAPKTANESIGKTGKQEGRVEA